MPEQRKLAILTAFVKAQEITALDEAVDVLDMLILDITREAKKTGLTIGIGFGPTKTLAKLANHAAVKNKRCGRPARSGSADSWP